MKINFKLQISLATADDAEGIFEVLHRTWLVTYINEEYDITVEVFEKKFQNREEQLKKIQGRIIEWKLPTFVVKNESGKVIAFNSPKYEIVENSDQKLQSLGGLYVLKEYQGNGIGKLLLKNNIEFWKSISSEPIYLHVVKFNKSTIDFYLKNGFKITGKEVSSNIDENHSLPGIEMIYIYSLN